MARKLTARERNLLVVLLVATPLVVWWLSPEATKVVVTETASARRQRVAAEEAAPVVELALLEARATDYDPRGRDLFKYHVPPPPQPKYEPPPYTPPPPPVVEAAPPRPIQGPRVEQPPAPTFRYIGLLGPKDAKFATFEIGKEIELRSVGEPIDKQFRLLEFRHDSVILGYEDARFKGRTTELKMRAK